MALLTESEKQVNSDLGYPPGYAKLCKTQPCHTRGPPHTFLPYTLHSFQVSKYMELNELFPVSCSQQPQAETPCSPKMIDVLWRQLDHLGNAGFDPALFRIDPYGNVVYFHADPASPLAWKIDHWFPLSRGGKSVLSNMRIVQWQAKKRKGDKLEFLVPWWDLQLGLSVNQFLSIFASHNIDFRERAFSFLFFSGKSQLLHEKMVAECHSWPQHFLDKKKQLGLAAAAIVRVTHDSSSNSFRDFSMNHNPFKAGGSFIGKRWTTEEDAALLKAIEKFKPEKEQQQQQTPQPNNLIVPVKNNQLSVNYPKKDPEGFQDFKNIELALAEAIQKQQILRKSRDEEIRKKVDEIYKLQDQLKQLIEHNTAQRSTLEDLEQALVKHRRACEKQRQLSDKQSSYKQCMEKMNREIMHQTVVYKEQARLYQAACNALNARLESLKADSDVSERYAWKKLKLREDIKELLRPYLEHEKKRLRDHDDTDRPSFSQAAADPPEEKKKKRIKHQQSYKAFQKELRQLLDEDTGGSSSILLEEEIQEDALVDAASSLSLTEHKQQSQDEQQEDQDQDQNQDDDDHDDNEEEVAKRAGKANIDKWLQILLHDTHNGNGGNRVAAEEEFTDDDENARALVYAQDKNYNYYDGFPEKKWKIMKSSTAVVRKQQQQRPSRDKVLHSSNTYNQRSRVTVHPVKKLNNPSLVKQEEHESIW